MNIIDAFDGSIFYLCFIHVLVHCFKRKLRGMILILYKHINQINVTYLNLVHVEACGSFIARRRELFHRDIGFE